MTDLWEELTKPEPKKPKRKKTPHKDSEAAVLKECLAWLKNQASVVYAERRNTGVVEIESRWVAFGRKGAADIFCRINIRPGMLIECGTPGRGFFPIIPVEIECKARHRGDLSADQKRFRENCHAVGIPYFVVHSVADLEEQLKSAGLIS